MDYSNSISTPQLVVLHNDWRGEYDIGSYAGSTLTKPCVHITCSSNFKTYTTDCTISDYPKAPGPLNTSWYHCVEVEWPAPHVWVTRETRNRSINGPLAWMGTLIDGMRDNSGQMYMRNRYYDPASGRFTQEDPIGLAGGLNVYGFADGDPVGYADPFGLCPGIPHTNQVDISDCPPGYFTVLLSAGGGISGAVIGGVSGGAACAEPGIGIVICGAEGAALGGRAGTAAGGFVGSALDAGIGYLRMANAGRGRGANRVPNDQVRRMYREYDLNSEGQEWVHDEISRENLSIDEIREVMEEAHNTPRFRNSPPPKEP